MVQVKMLPESTLEQIAEELSLLTRELWAAVHVAATPQEIGRWELRAEDGRAIRHQSIWNQSDRVSWYGSYPRFPDGMRSWFSNDSLDSIGTAANRAPKAIARDIARRLLPGYTTRFRDALAQIAAMKQRAEHYVEEIAALVAAGATAPGKNNPEHRCYVEHRPGRASGMMKVNGDGTVDVDFHGVPLAVTVEFVRALKGNVS